MRKALSYLLVITQMATLPYFLRNTIQMHVEKEHSKMTGLGHLQWETEQDPYIKEESLQRVQLSSQHLYTGPLSTPMLYMNTHTHTHICRHTCMHACTHRHMHTHTCIQIHARMCTHTCVCVCVCVCMHRHAYVHACLHVCIGAYICMNVCV